MINDKKIQRKVYKFSILSLFFGTVYQVLTFGQPPMQFGTNRVELNGHDPIDYQEEKDWDISMIIKFVKLYLIFNINTKLKHYLFIVKSIIS